MWSAIELVAFLLFILLMVEGENLIKAWRGKK